MSPIQLVKCTIVLSICFYAYFMWDRELYWVIHIEIWDIQNRPTLICKAMGASINIQLVRVWLVISVDWENGTGMDHIVSATTTFHDSSRLCYCANQCRLRKNSSIDDNVRSNHVPCSFPQVKNKPHDGVQIVHLFLSSVRPRTVIYPTCWN
jgi:hypothetical protein